MSTRPAQLQVEEVRISELRPHPRNYRLHPEEELRHLTQSLREHGLYRNVVIAEDGTILAGHGVVEAAAHLGRETVSAHRLPISPDSPQALKVMTADNELARLAESDQRQLADLLEEITAESLDALLGTGFDQASMDALLMGAGVDPAEAWEGMPDFDADDLRPAFRAAVYFRTEEDAASFFQMLDRPMTSRLWWPEHDGHKGEQSKQLTVEWVEE